MDLCIRVRIREAERANVLLDDDHQTWPATAFMHGCQTLICRVCMGMVRAGPVLTARLAEEAGRLPALEEAQEDRDAELGDCGSISLLCRASLVTAAPRLGLPDRLLRWPAEEGSFAPSAASSWAMPLSGCCTAISASSCMMHLQACQMP